MQDHCDYDEYISMVTTTRTPDVPSGGVFSVKTRTCLTWAGPASTRVVVTTEVEWTGKSWVKGEYILVYQMLTRQASSKSLPSRARSSTTMTSPMACDPT